MGPVVTSSSGSLTLQGRVHGGQQGISGATIQLYQVGTTGNASAASPMIGSSQYYLGGAPGCVPSGTQVCYSSVITDANGYFTITGDYSCPTANTQVYIVATGGNPGLASGTNNPALVLMTALGSCYNLQNNTPFVTLNEVTTAAAAWALAPFMTSYTNVGASSTNSAGIINAFLDAQLIANAGTGTAATLASNLTTEPNKLYALADALAGCVNSDGTGCSLLFNAAKPAGGTAPSNTLNAALNIVKNPGQNVAAVFAAISGVPPFATTYTQAPNDWTMSLTITSPQMLLPTALDIDANGYVWMVGQEGILDEYGPQGTVVNDLNYVDGYLNESFGLTVDTNGYIWVTDFQSNADAAGAVVLFYGSNTSSPGSPVTYFDDNSVQYPDAIAADSNGDVYDANSYSSSGSIYNTSGVISGFLGTNYNYATDPQAIAVDSSHGFWLSDGDNTVSHYNSSGGVLGYVNCCEESYGIATDAGGNLWVANYADSTYSEVTTTNSVPVKLKSGGGVYYPAGVAVDAGQNVWFTNYRGMTISEIAGNGGTVLSGTTTPLAAGTPISPSTGTYGGNGGYGLDASLSLPLAIVPDSAGNIWVANEGNNDLVMFFGLATPTKMPVQPTPTAP